MTSLTNNSSALGCAASGAKDTRLQIVPHLFSSNSRVRSNCKGGSFSTAILRNASTISSTLSSTLSLGLPIAHFLHVTQIHHACASKQRVQILSGSARCNHVKAAMPLAHHDLDHLCVQLAFSTLLVHLPHEVT